MDKNLDENKTKRPARVTGKVKADDRVFFNGTLKLSSDLELTEYNTKHLNSINSL